MSDSAPLTEYRRGGERTSRERVIEQNLPLVYAIARRFSRSPEQMDELVQMGALGLIKAVDGFEEARGTDLGAYAVPTIVGELRRSVDQPAWPGKVPRDGAGVARRRVVVPLDEELLEAPAGTTELDRSEQRMLLDSGLRTLSRRERTVIVLRYYRDWSQQRIAEELGISQPQVSRVLATAIEKLRAELTRTTRRRCATRHTRLR